MVPSTARTALGRVASKAFPFGAALLAVAAACALRLAAGAWLADDPSVMFLAAVAITAWRFGVLAGTFAVASSAVAQGLLFMAPDVVFLATLQEAVALGLGALEGVLVCFLFEAMHRARARAAEISAREVHLVRKEALATAANRAKTEFLANMSHELRTPMTAILGFGELLFDDGLAPKERTDYLNVIQRSGKHLLGLIDEILDLSRIETDEIELTRVPCSPRGIIADVAKAHRGSALDKGLSLRIVYATPIPATIECDPVRLRQILMNLVSNGVKFTSKGSLTITARCLDPEGPSPSLALEVEDTGVGVAADMLEHVFELFSQADASTTRRFGGTGLGLTISSRLARALGGAITVASKVGEGSTFTLTLPAGSPEPREVHVRRDRVCTTTRLGAER